MGRGQERDGQRREEGEDKKKKRSEAQDSVTLAVGKEANCGGAEAQAERHWRESECSYGEVYSVLDPPCISGSRCHGATNSSVGFNSGRPQWTLDTGGPPIGSTVPGVNAVNGPGGHLNLGGLTGAPARRSTQKEGTVDAAGYSVFISILPAATGSLLVLLPRLKLPLKPTL